jgi:hypothetical protein
MNQAIIVGLILSTIVLGSLIVEGIRRIRSAAPRYTCAIRVSRSVWLAWDEPAIAERREAQQARALADQMALERALIEVAHQKEVGR